MLSESRLRKLIQSASKSYDLGVVIGPDFYFLNTIDVQTIEQKLATHKNSVFVSNFIPRSDIQIEDGFYIGTPRSVAKILNMWNRFAYIAKHHHCFNYERALGITSIIERLHLLHHPIAYLKIRNNHSVSRLKPILNTYTQLKNKPSEIMDNIRALFQKHTELHILKDAVREQGELKDNHPLCQI